MQRAFAELNPLAICQKFSIVPLSLVGQCPISQPFPRPTPTTLPPTLLHERRRHLVPNAPGNATLASSSSA